MNKLELVEALREETGLNKSEATAVVGMFFGEMANALAKGDWVEIRELWEVIERINKKIGQKGDIPPWLTEMDPSLLKDF